MAVQCRDDHEKCESWALANDCVSNPDYMSLKCQKSCGICDCVDTGSNCATLAANGKCKDKDNANFMSVSNVTHFNQIQSSFISSTRTKYGTRVQLYHQA